MANSIHISTARAILNAHEPVCIAAWKSDGTVMRLQNCISISCDPATGTRRVKLLDSQQIRRLRDICIFEVNDLEVFV